MIDKETAEVLKPKDVKPARLYVLPKIHKKNIPGRPVISSIRDTTNVINKLQNIAYIPHNAILATLDVKSLYSNINHNEGLLALEECLDNRAHKEPSTKVITTFMHHILTLNNLNVNGRHFLQTKGCAMGTIAAPSYPTMYMGRFETLYIYTLKVKINRILTYEGYLRFHDLWMQASSQYEREADGQRTQLCKKTFLRDNIQRVGRVGEWHIDCFLASTGHGISITLHT